MSSLCGNWYSLYIQIAYVYKGNGILPHREVCSASLPYISDLIPVSIILFSRKIHFSQHLQYRLVRFLIFFACQSAETEGIQLLGTVPAIIHPLEVLWSSSTPNTRLQIDQKMLCFIFSFFPALDAVVQILWEMRVFEQEL